MNFTGKLEGLKMDYATKKQSISVPGAWIEFRNMETIA